jgi:hypothetical protein
MTSTRRSGRERPIKTSRPMPGSKSGPGNARHGLAPQGWIGQLVASRVAGAMLQGGPNEPFMHYVQNTVWNFLCDHYFRLEIDGWHRIPDEPSLLIGTHPGGALTMDAWTLLHSSYRHFEGRRILPAPDAAPLPAPPRPR